MTPTALIAELNRRGIEIAVRGTRLCCRPAGSTIEDLRGLLAKHKAALVELLTTPTISTSESEAPQNEEPSEAGTPLIEDGFRVRWLKKDERGCRPCKRCGKQIIWAKITHDSSADAKRRWIKLDPDLMGHACDKTRNFRIIETTEAPSDSPTAVAPAAPSGFVDIPITELDRRVIDAIRAGETFRPPPPEVPDAAIPDGWTRAAWIERLKQLADTCVHVRPALAAAHLAEAERLARFEPLSESALAELTARQMKPACMRPARAERQPACQQPEQVSQHVLMTSSLF